MSVAGPPLGRFLYEKSWTPVWGCYLNPLRFFGEATDYQSMALPGQVAPSKVKP
jgi:hypothetical protein